MKVKKSHKVSVKRHVIGKKQPAISIPKKTDIKLISTYNFQSDNIPITIKIYTKKGEFVPIYDVSISGISKNTEVVLNKIMEELTSQVSLGMVDVLDTKETGVIEEKFTQAIELLLNKHFPDASKSIISFLKSYLIQKSLGLGSIEILMDDITLEEIAINNADEPVWVYHIKYGWLKTTITLQNEEQIRHYASMIGRRIGRQITILEPLMDAHLATGDRVNATLGPISVKGNTITLRKFAAKPWTITDFIKSETISTGAAALIWLGVQYELSALISGGTATGKTSMLNRLQSVMKGHSFVYLDAQDLPENFNLEEELKKKRTFFDRLRLKNFPSKKPVLIIDEFQVTNPNLILEARSKWESTENKRIKSIVIAQISKRLKNVSASFKERL